MIQTRLKKINLSEKQLQLIASRSAMIVEHVLECEHLDHYEDESLEIVFDLNGERATAFVDIEAEAYWSGERQTDVTPDSQWIESTSMVINSCTIYPDTDDEGVELEDYLVLEMNEYLN